MIRFSFALGLAALVSSVAAAQETGGKAPNVPFPAQATSWVGSPPLSASMLEGKAALLWFYEEGCPSCRAKWPPMLASAKKFEGKPIVFIAVNSGNSRNEVEGYLRDVGCNWPTIVDEDRSFEKAVGVPEVSLQNIYQMRLILADGRVMVGNSGDFEGMANKALEGAKWKVDPADIPLALKPAWQGIEMGSYASAAALVKKSLTSPKADVKAAAEKLNDAVKDRIEGLMTAAKKAEEAGQKWPAYKSYSSIAADFKGYDIPADVAAKVKELSGDTAVKTELAAFKTLEGAKKSLGATSAVARKRGVNQLEKLVADQGTTEAAQEAKSILTHVGGQ